MGHDHAHSGHGHHHHGDVVDADRRLLGVALGLILGFFAVEVVLGLLANSLALLTDAAHMLTDAASIGLALVAARYAARPVTGGFTFGFRRAEVMAALINGVSLLVLAGVLGFEATRRLVAGSSPEVDGVLVIVVGCVGALVNVAVAVVLGRAARQSINVKGARAHVLADLYASVAAAVAGVGIVVTGIGQIDTVAATIVVALMVRSGWSLTRASGRMLMEATPEGIDAMEIGRDLARQRGVVEVHDLHVWEVTSGMVALTAHVVVAADADCHATRFALARLLRDVYAIDHSTLQVDHDRGEDLLTITPRQV